MQSTVNRQTSISSESITTNVLASLATAFGNRHGQAVESVGFSASTWQKSLINLSSQRKKWINKVESKEKDMHRWEWYFLSWLFPSIFLCMENKQQRWWHRVVPAKQVRCKATGVEEVVMYLALVGSFAKLLSLDLALKLLQKQLVGKTVAHKAPRS